MSADTKMVDPIALIAATRAKREALGTNVHFINSAGKPDCYSFATLDSAAKFRAALIAKGREIIPAPLPFHGDACAHYPLSDTSFCIDCGEQL